MPDRPRVVVVNTTPLIALTAVGKLPLLSALYPDGILVPDDVWLEYQAGSPAHRVADLAAIAVLRRTRLADPRRAQLLADLDPGEAAVIALGQERHADLLIIDERLGRRHARRLGFGVTGTVGVLLRAKQMALLDRIGPILGSLRARGLHLGDEIVREALFVAGESRTGTTKS